MYLTGQKWPRPWHMWCHDIPVWRHISLHIRIPKLSYDELVILPQDRIDDLHKSMESVNIDLLLEMQR